MSVSPLSPKKEFDFDFKKLTMKITLQRFFNDNPHVALAFSGGVDSSYLLYIGLHYGAKIRPYFVKTAFQPEFELRDARRVAEYLETEITVIETDVLNNAAVVSNPLNRCYHCKKNIFEVIRAQAFADGVPLVIDGTNASDDAGERPGMKALAEQSVRSPLRECGITKSNVRQLSKETGLFTWNKPAYACLATRVPFGQKITEDLLRRIEKSEDALFAFGFTDFRVRVMGDNVAKLQFQHAQMGDVVNRRADIVDTIKRYFSTILLDLDGRVINE